MNKKIFIFGNVSIEEKNNSFLPGGVFNILTLCSIFTNDFILVTNVGDDRFAKIIMNQIKKMNLNIKYIKKIRNTRTTWYRVPENTNKNPKWERICSDPKLMNVPYEKIPLSKAAFIYFFSLGTMFYAKDPTRTIKMIKKASSRGITALLDLNVRPAYVEDFRDRVVHSDSIRDVLTSFSSLKLNEEEAYLLDKRFRVKGIEQIHLTEKKLNGFAKDIQSIYDLKEVIITLGHRGSYYYSEEEKLRFGIIGKRYLNPTGTGDAFSAGIALRSIFNLSNKEALAIATVLGGMVASRGHLVQKEITKELIRKTIKKNEPFFKKHDVNFKKLLNKLCF